MSGMRVLVVGRPGSGKGTQCERLAAALRLPNISTGELLRSAIESGTAIGDAVRDTVSGGRLVPAAVVGLLVRERLARRDVVERGFLLDGYPRTCEQLADLRQLLAPESIGVVIELVVSAPTAMDRLVARGRGDDTMESVRRRLDEFEQETEPMLVELRERELVVPVDAERRVSEITAELFDRLVAPVWSDGDVLPRRSTRPSLPRVAGSRVAPGRRFDGLLPGAGTR